MNGKNIRKKSINPFERLYNPFNGKPLIDPPATIEPPAIKPPVTPTKPPVPNVDLDTILAKVNYNPAPEKYPKPSTSTQPSTSNSTAPVTSNIWKPVSSSMLITKQSSNSDPRLAIQPPPIKPPFTMDAIFTKLDKQVAFVKLESAKYCTHHLEIQQLIEKCGLIDNHKVIRISTFLPIDRVNDIIDEDNQEFLSIIGKEQIVELAKLRGFMQVNQVVGIVSHSEIPTQCLVVFPISELKKLDKLKKEAGIDLSNYSQWCAVWLNNLAPKPTIQSMDYQFDEQDLMDNALMSWYKVATFLKFPKELIERRKTAKFMAYGHSELTLMINNAANLLKPTRGSGKPSQHNPAHILMYDRLNESLFSKQLLKHKREAGTQLWEFGVPDFSYGEMMPPCQVFPAYSGGLITTDVQNILQNPFIINTIIEQKKKLNVFSMMYGSWKFVLPDNILVQLKKSISYPDAAKRANSAVLNMTAALNNNEIEILKLWPAYTEERNNIEFIEAVLRNYYKTHQYFVYVDDSLSITTSTKERHKAIDFVHSTSIFTTFKP